MKPFTDPVFYKLWGALVLLEVRLLFSTLCLLTLLAKIKLIEVELINLIAIFIETVLGSEKKATLEFIFVIRSLIFASMIGVEGFRTRILNL